MSAQPAIFITRHDHRRLLALLDRHPDSEVAAALAAELDRATLVDTLPADVVGMHSRVHFRNEANGHEHSVLLAWPETAAQHPGGLSVLTPAGAALLGLRTGNVIDWPAPAGLLRLRLLATTPV